MKIIILGPTGAGKGTQAKHISKLLKIKHIDLGENFRKIAKKNRYINEVINKGRLIPDSIVLKLVDKLTRNKKNFILDGFPRKLSQAKAFKNKIDLVLFLKISKNEVVKRLRLRKRADDDLKNINERYKIYLKQTIPVVNYYKKKGILVAINGNPSIKRVSKEIKEVLEGY